jgi:hypothetical protein
MKRRSIAAGETVSPDEDRARRFAEVVDRGDMRDGKPSDGYLDDPSVDRVGICCSGGGIRAASYALGALQVLRERGRLATADHLASVSGGDYMTVAHHIMVSETLKNGTPPPGLPPGNAAKEAAFFDPLAPWARLSPEEQNLRDHTTYLAPGLGGRAWFGLNLIYGMVRHMVPFGAGIVAVGAALGIAFERWIGEVLRLKHGATGPSVKGPFIVLAVVVAALGVAAGIVLFVRQEVLRHSGNTKALKRLRAAATTLLGVQALVLLFGMGLPALLLLLHAQVHLQSPATRATAGAGAAVGSLGIVSFLGRLAKKGVKSDLAKKLVPRLMPLALALLGPIVVGVPLVAATYYAALRGSQSVAFRLWPHIGPVHVAVWLIALPVVLLAVYALWLDEVTSSIHLFYRERLSTVFTGLRNAETVGGRLLFRFGQPDWNVPVRFSEESPGSAAGKLPNLVVCAAVNVSDDVLPPGRLAGSFTFERDFSGGPLTGYVPTRVLEDAAGPGVLTLPAMMAISGAAVSPSMGKMTRPWARFLLALFNARLGVWVPNPLWIQDFGAANASMGARQVREARATPPPAQAPGAQAQPMARRRRPGTGYVLREALGWNHLGNKYVYATDGGHWDNLGLVELIRRGCGLILCFDAAGDDLDHFHTLSEAIELARSDLGVQIVVDLEPLKPDPKDPDGFSDRPYARGCIRYPDGTLGFLLFAKAAITRDTPQDALDWRERDPRFPTNSTVDQWFSDRQFESYRALGEFAARRVLCALEEWEALSPAARRAELENLRGDCPPPGPSTPTDPGPGGAATSSPA